MNAGPHQNYPEPDVKLGNVGWVPTHQVRPNYRDGFGTRIIGPGGCSLAPSLLRLLLSQRK